MDSDTWQGVVAVFRQTQTTMMADGLVIHPTLMPFVGGRLAGVVSLRPVYRGQDAIDGIGEMSTFAAAARADEIVVAWESGDIAVACDLPPARPGSALAVLWATVGERRLFLFPYEEQQLPGRLPNGMLPVAPRWLTPVPATVPNLLEPAIESLVEFSFQPFDNPAATPESAAAYLIEAGYPVRQTI